MQFLDISRHGSESDYPYTFMTTDLSGWKESMARAIDWAHGEFGPWTIKPELGRWAFSTAIIQLRDEDDAMVFKLRWC